MADSVGHKAQVVDSNMINRTTSESIRLGESDKTIQPSTLSATSTLPKKKTSFQITSVTVGSHTSNDGGEDSADDLDESHAEDISDVIDISRTDLEIETPSYSEDTFSKDDVFFNSSTSLGTAPVIPTSSQYGLAIVSTPEGCNNILNSNISGGNNASGKDLHVSVTDNVINLGIVSGKHLEGDMRDLHNHTSRNERFKVVKIESTEPFKRGRWTCMDYLDHSMSQQQQNQIQNQGTNISANNKVADNSELANVNTCTNTDSGISMSDHPNTVTTLEENNTNSIENSGNNSSVSGQDQTNLIPHSVTGGVCGQNSVSPGQTMQFNSQAGNVSHSNMNVSQPQPIQQQGQSLTSAITNQHAQINTNQHQSLQPQQIQQVISATNMHGQPASIGNQQIQQQPLQQMQHQGMSIQHVHQIHQSQAPANMVTQQYQQASQQLQQIHHQPQSLQGVQQSNQTIIQQQQPTMNQHLQHQHNISMPIQQQLNQGQIPVQVLTNQATMQQLPQQTNQIPVHSQMQQIQQNILQQLQNAAISPMSLSGVVNSASQVLQAQNSQQQQYHLPTSQSMMQQGVQSQPALMSLPQTQYFTNSQIQNNMSVQQPISSNTVIQAQTQANPNIAMQQNYSVNSINQQQPQQIAVGHPIPPSSIPHISQSQIPTTSVAVIMSQPNTLPGGNLPIPASQNAVTSPQATSQGPTIVQQQYPNQPVASSLAQTQSSTGIQVFASSALNAGVPSNLENTGIQSYQTDQTGNVYPVNQQTESQSDATGGEETQLEDTESTSGASAVAIDNKIEQAMDLVKSHLMFAVREEVEVLKEKISELMERITLLENENQILRASASQETLAQLSLMQPSTSNAP